MKIRNICTYIIDVNPLTLINQCGVFCAPSDVINFKKPGFKCALFQNIATHTLL